MYEQNFIDKHTLFLGDKFMSLTKKAVQTSLTAVLTSMLVFALPMSANASNTGYLIQKDGTMVTSGKGECWGTKNAGNVALPEACGGAAPAPEPVAAPVDSDGDGVVDADDQCPNTPAGAPVDATGCPLDSDGDGVYDYMDECPGTPLGDTVDAKGCSINFTLSGDVLFDTASAKIKPEAYRVLDNLYDQLTSVGVSQLNVIGHADSRGSQAYNQGLSERRAESVRQYLINKGMSPSSLVAKGSGELYPVADNSTEVGRRLNRRVEFEVVQ